MSSGPGQYNIQSPQRGRSVNFGRSPKNPNRFDYIEPGSFASTCLVLKIGCLSSIINDLSALFDLKVLLSIKYRRQKRTPEVPLRLPKEATSAYRFPLSSWVSLYFLDLLVYMSRPEKTSPGPKYMVPSTLGDGPKCTFGQGLQRPNPIVSRPTAVQPASLRAAPLNKNAPFHLRNN